MGTSLVVEDLSVGTDWNLHSVYGHRFGGGSIP